MANAMQRFNTNAQYTLASSGQKAIIAMSTFGDECEHRHCKKCASACTKHTVDTGVPGAPKFLARLGFLVHIQSELGGLFLIMMMANFKWTHKNSLSSAADVHISICCDQGLTRAAVNVYHDVLFQHIFSSSIT